MRKLRNAVVMNSIVTNSLLSPGATSTAPAPIVRTDSSVATEFADLFQSPVGESKAIVNEDPVLYVRLKAMSAVELRSARVLESNSPSVNLTCGKVFVTTSVRKASILVFLEQHVV